MTSTQCPACCNLPSSTSCGCADPTAARLPPRRRRRRRRREYSCRIPAPAPEHCAGPPGWYPRRGPDDNLNLTESCRNPSPGRWRVCHSVSIIGTETMTSYYRNRRPGLGPGLGPPRPVTVTVTVTPTQQLGVTAWASAGPGPARRPRQLWNLSSQNVL